MIVTEFYKGQGLGNQLACYVTTRVIAKNKGYKFGIKNPNNFKGLDFMNLDFGETVIGGNGPEGGPPKKLPDGIKHYYVERKITHPITGADIRIYDPNLMNVLDNTKIDGVMQDEQYMINRKNEIRDWLRVKPEYECFDYSDENTCIINFRGGEYTRHKDFFLDESYWRNAVSKMLEINPNFRFIVITDDVKSAKKFFPNYGVFHFSIAKDYVVIKNAHYLILSNSSFAWFPAWLNTNLKYCIAPKYWGRYNISDGYWSSGYNITKGWMYLDRNGNLYDYQTCIEEFNNYKKKHSEYWPELKIKDNFLVISSYNHDLRWVGNFTDNYIIYDRSEKLEIPDNIDPKKIIKSPNVGYNSFDYFTFIIDNYDNLPECTIFAKGWSFPRHVRKDYFTKIMNNKFFTPIEDWKMHKPKFPISFFSPEGGYCEINNSWYLKHWKTKYFKNYNDFLRFVYKDPVIPKYTRFAPGGDYIVPKENILKVPKIVYENLRLFMSHCQEPGETHIIERACHTLWTSNFEFSAEIQKPLNESFVFRKKTVSEKIKDMTPIKIKNLVKSAINETKHLLNLATKPIDLIIESRRKKEWLSKIEISKYRKSIKIYDIFNFFNELDLLEIRLNILNDYVDYFVIVESTLTHQGKPKELLYLKNKDRFKKFEGKIIHCVIENPLKNLEDAVSRLNNPSTLEFEKDIIKMAMSSDNLKPEQESFLRDFYEKEYVKKPILGKLKDDDFCYISDLDEIWNPQILIDYSKDDIFRYKQDPYIYYLNNRSNEDWRGWTGTIATKYKNIKNSCVNHLRTHGKTKTVVLKNGGWHFSFQGGIEKIKEKIESYSHEEINNEKIKSKIKDVIIKNKDIRGRYIRFWKDESGLPKYLLENKEKYINLFK